MKKLLILSIVLGGFAGIKAGEFDPTKLGNKTPEPIPVVWEPIQGSSCSAHNDCSNAFKTANSNFNKEMQTHGLAPGMSTPNQYSCLNSVCQIGWSSSCPACE